MLFVVLLLGAVNMALAADQPADEKKRTSLGLYADAKEAYAMWQADKKVIILDVRTPEEYVFVGHAPMAVNVPIQHWAGKWNAEKKQFPLAENADFAAQVKKIAKEDDTLLVMCRSGHRSAAAIKKLVEAGFKKAYNIVDGFEGDVVKDKASPNVGKRMVDGWKMAGAPWGYELDETLVFKP
jgi:rhodanese-related sulfurtransferase